MYIKVNDIDLKILQDASNITMTTYEKKDDLVNTEHLITIIEDLIYAYESKEEELEEFKEHVRENYKEKDLPSWL